MKRRRTSSLPSLRIGHLPGLTLALLSCLLLSIEHIQTAKALPFIQRRTNPKSGSSLTTLLEIRGGDNPGNHESIFTAIGIQVVGSIGNQARSSLQSGEGSNYMLMQGNSLLQSTSSSCNRLWDGDAAAVEALSICCDVMVVVAVVDSSKTTSDDPLLDSSLVNALERGLRHRASNGMQSSVLILLVSESKTSSTLASQKDRLVLQELSHLTPSLVSSLDLLSLDDAEEAAVGLGNAWNDILRDMALAPERTTSHLVESEAFQQFLCDVYQSKGGNRPEFLKQLKKTETETVEEETVLMESNNIDLSMTEDVCISSSESSAEEEADHSGDETLGQEDPMQHNTVANEEALLTMLNTARNQIRELETEQEQLWLGFSNDDLSNSKGLLEFGSSAAKIIGNFQTGYSESLDEGLQPRAKQYLWQHILPPLKQLYDQHLQFLREQFGKRYEAALQQTATSQISLEEHQSLWKEAAAQVTAAFREAAQGAVPAHCQPGGSLRDANFDYVPSLEGLLSDMMQATEEHEELMGIEPGEGDEGGVAPSGDQRRGKRPAKWYEKAAAKAFVFAVNYFQGWLAYQGIKRAAAQRDAHLPKFPLF